MSVQVKVMLPEETVAAVKEIATRHGINESAALARAVERERVLDREVATGGRVLVEKPDGSFLQVTVDQD